MRSATPASVITLLAGVWLFVSPWVYGTTTQNAWNSWIVGALMFIFALTRLNSTNSAGMSWLNTVRGSSRHHGCSDTPEIQAGLSIACA